MDSPECGRAPKAKHLGINPSPTSGSGDTSHPPEYELRRLRNIERNRQILATLGIQAEKTALVKSTPPRPRRRSLPRRHPPLPLTPSRRSARLRGEAPENFEEMHGRMGLVSSSSTREEGEEEEREGGPVVYVRSRFFIRHNIIAEIPEQVFVPVTLCSIGTTIWNIGRLPLGPNAAAYRSSSGCRFDHRYPIGFKAEKQYFGHTFTMEIRQGKGHPLFLLTRDDGVVFTGPTPTYPWTQACLRSNSPGTRISGPLFFGFSDLLTQKLLRELDVADGVYV